VNQEEIEMLYQIQRRTIKTIQRFDPSTVSSVMGVQKETIALFDDKETMQI
jgi:hypothetical protein